MRKVFLLALALLSATAAEARPHKQGHHDARPSLHRVHAAHVRGVSRGSSGGRSALLGGGSLVAEARSQIGNGAIYGRATLWCARFVNYVLKVTGHTGTGSDTASSFAHYGTRISGPQVGAIAVMGRRGGGHVGVVSGVDSSGNPIIVSGNHNRRVAETVYPKGRVYAYVLPN
jgi:uncharacterized protein (TIGR02594 family)